jgi:hypothetical protein
MHGKSVSGVVTHHFIHVPPRQEHLIMLVERQRRALRLFFILERPG